MSELIKVYRIKVQWSSPKPHISIIITHSKVKFAVLDVLRGSQVVQLNSAGVWRRKPGTQNNSFLSEPQFRRVVYVLVHLFALNRILL